MDEIEEIDAKEAYEIICDPSKAIPGMFLHKENNLYVGIDNTTHDAWVEEFKIRKECVAWLRRESS